MNKLLLLFSALLSTLIIFSFLSYSTPGIDAASDEEDFEENNSIVICCTPEEKLSDRKLTYEMQGKIDSEHKEAVVNAIRDWDDKLTFIKFIDISDSKKQQKYEKPDILIKFLKYGAEFGEEGAETAGNTKTRLDKIGFIKYNIIIIAEGGLGKIFDKKL